MLESLSRFDVVLAAALIIGFTGMAHAQTDPCVGLWPVSVSCTGFCLDQAPPTTVCPSPCTGMVGCTCTYKKAVTGCTLPNLATDTCPSCTTAGQPINLATGNTYIVETDVTVPGLGGGLSLVRTWNSILPANQTGTPFMFGRNWRSNLEERVFPGTDSYMKYSEGDGSVRSYGVSSTANGLTVYNRVAPGTGGEVINTDNSATTITLVSQSGETKVFDSASGRLLSISDRNGNTTQLTYDSSNRLVTVTDAALRHLYFTYTSPTSNLVGTVTSDVGITLSYTYDDQGRLINVTKPDNTTTSYQFDANSNITAVLDNAGKILESHTYDAAGRGLTSSRANGIEAVTVSYPH